MARTLCGAGVFDFSTEPDVSLHAAAATIGSALKRGGGTTHTAVRGNWSMPLYTLVSGPALRTKKIALSFTA
ncbi:MAG: hypothetical protein GF363_14580 [Chitinivibrionales bacterium]|nr:hypothetical protein [Chitinivibrionales bacterium]